VPPGLGFRVDGEAGSYLRLIDFVYHSTPGLRVIKKKKGEGDLGFAVLLEKLLAPVVVLQPDRLFRGGLVFKSHRLSYHSTLGLKVIKKAKSPIACTGRVALPFRVWGLEFLFYFLRILVYLVIYDSG